MKQFVDLATGVRLEYVTHGSSSGQAILFLHGVTDSWHSFERVLPLLPQDLRAFAITQRGHGDSSRPERGYGFTDLSADVRAFMDAAGLSRAIIVGHSMGASVAQRLVIDHPERVDGIVLMGAFASFRDPGLVEFVRTAIMPLADPIDETFVRDWQLSTLARAMDSDHFETIVRETLKVPARVWHAAFDGFLRTQDFTEELRTVNAPALLMWGDQDTYATHDAQHRLRSVLPATQLIAYPGYGHALHWEDPAMIVTDLVRFVDRVRGVSPVASGAASQVR